MLRISISDENAQELQRLTGKTLTKNGNQIIAELIERADKNKKLESPCWIENDCSEQDKEEEKS